MLRKKEKAQGLVEFALILPVLLLLLLGIIEAARVIWAYITVQTAVREAARYAISGQPYAFSNFSTYCVNPQGEPNAQSPWVCDPVSRTVAIENVAMNRITTSLNVSTPCRSLGYAQCEGVPNAYGVRIIGQRTDELTPTVVFTDIGHAGQQGLNIKVMAYYNVQMFDPIFDRIMGGNVIPVRAELSMQNEGIDKALGGVPPPAINSSTNITGTGSGGDGPSGERIRAQNYRIPQLGNLPVELINHFNLAGPYDIYLSQGTPETTFKICTGVNTDPATNNGDFSCFISGTIPTGFYTLYSTLFGNLNPLATDNTQQVEIFVSEIAKIQVDNGAGSNVLVANSIAQITMVAHQVTNQPYTLTVVYGVGPTEQVIFSGVTVVSATNTVKDWLVPVSLLSPSNPCPAGGTTACLIRSYDKNGVNYATGEFYLNQPEIVIAGGLRTFSRNETMHITLRGHAPGVPYDLEISDSSGTTQRWLGRTDPTDAAGQVTNPVNWTIPADWPADPPPGGTGYTITSHPAQGNEPRSEASMTAANQVADLGVQINGPAGPYLTIDGGYTWPAGSRINIQANKHPQATEYYFRFGPWRVPIPTGNPVDTFKTDSNEVFIASYQIPLTATVGVTTTFVVSSFNNANGNVVATRQVTVLPVPVIRVVEGSVVAPETVITIQLLNHNPDTTYRIVYLDKFLGNILTNANGQGQLKYDLRQLPIDSPPGLSTSYGTAYNLFSQSLAGATIATTPLTLRAADLRVTSIQIPPNPAINSTIRLTFTVQNTSPVTITRYFDTDAYFNPSPLVPAYVQGQFNFPGDYKYWLRPPNLAPGATFSFTQPYTIGSYGPHVFYGYADTSNFILEGDAREFNNILSNTLTLVCTPSFITDTFTSTTVLNANWATQLYGNADNNGTNPQIVTVSSNERLRLTSDGSSTLRSSDNANVSGRKPASGYTFLRRTTPIITAGGLDVRVQVMATTVSVEGAKMGLELRDPPSNVPTNAKVEFGLTRNASGQYLVEVAYRDSANPEPIVTFQSSSTLSLGTPIWLRIQRYGGTNTFLFYYVQSASVPTNWGAPVHTATIDLDNQLEYGVFMNNGTSGSHDTTDFDNFAFGNPASCPAAQGQPPDTNIPPGLATCTDPLKEQGFETSSPVNWFGIGSSGVFLSSSSHTGNNSLLADTNRPGFNNPVFYQRFKMPTTLVSGTTTVKLELFKNVERESDGSNPNDQFKVVLATSPSLASAVTIPAMVASGDQGANNYTPANWQKVTLNLAPASGFNLADYAGQDLFLYFYNNSNQLSGCPPATLNCQNTSFYFDDIKLSPCTVQPIPTTINTRIQGTLVVHPLAGSAQKIAGVKVWAYAENGQLFETVTIQNGEFNFYNLDPVTTAGVKYFIYAEHFISSSTDPGQIETLTGNASVVLTSANNNTNPVVTRLDLY
ncbi:MAG: pilus assembly protein [Anaerolineales bacterium]|nr:pilus assembly protein [Anaerolineales bacterium]